MHAFCKICEHEIVFVFICNNVRFTTLTKHVNNQTNCRNTFKILKEIWICMSGMVWYGIHLAFILLHKFHYIFTKISMTVGFIKSAGF